MFRICEGETGKWMRKTARLRGDGAERARFDAKRGNAAKKARQRGMWAPFGIPQRLTLAMKLPWHYRVGAHPPDASLTCGWVRKNEEADTEFSRLRGNGVQRVHSDAASGSRATAVVRPFGSAPHTHPASPRRKLDLRLGKEERGSGYGASAATRRKRSGARPF